MSVQFIIVLTLVNKLIDKSWSLIGSGEREEDWGKAKV